MLSTRWQPFSPVWNQLAAFQNEMNRLFDRWAGDRPSLLEGPGYPALNVWEDGEQVFVEAEVPGLNLADLEIYVTGGNTLTVKGERKPPAVDKALWHRQERGHGKFVRALTLPFPVDADKVEARLDNGVLSLKLSK